jgi:hypothetical protein
MPQKLNRLDFVMPGTSLGVLASTVFSADPKILERQRRVDLISLASFVILESIRQGMRPKNAGMAALKRIKSQTIEKRLLNTVANLTLASTSIS